MLLFIIYFLQIVSLKKPVKWIYKRTKDPNIEICFQYFTDWPSACLLVQSNATQHIGKPL